LLLLLREKEQTRLYATRPHLEGPASPGRGRPFWSNFPELLIPR